MQEATQIDTLALSPEAAVARLRLRSFTVRPHGLKWRVTQDGSETILMLDIDDLALAARLTQASKESLAIDELHAQLQQVTSLQNLGWSFTPAEKPDLAAAGWYKLNHSRLDYGRQEPNLLTAIKAAASYQRNYERADEIHEREQVTAAASVEELAPFWASISAAHQTGHYWFPEQRDGVTVWVACGRSEPQTTRPSNTSVKHRCTACERVASGARKAEAATEATGAIEEQLRAHGWRWTANTNRGQEGYVYNNNATYESCWHPSHEARLARDAEHPYLYAELIPAGWSAPALGDPSAIYRRPPSLPEFSSIPRERITRGRYQPRTAFDEQELQELAESIKEHGIIDPVVVFVNERGLYELIAGERRTRAAEMAGLSELPARIVEASDDAIHKISVFENIQRANLNVLEEGAAFERLAQTMSEAQLAREISRPRSYIQQRRALARSAPEVQEALLSGKIDFTRARAIVAGAPKDHVAQRRTLKQLNEEQERGRLVKEDKALAMADRAQLDRAKKDLKALGWLWNTRYTESTVVYSPGDRPRVWTGEEIALALAERRRPSPPLLVDVFGAIELSEGERAALSGLGWNISDKEYAPWLYLHGFDLEAQWLSPSEAREEAVKAQTTLAEMIARYAARGWDLHQENRTHCSWAASSPKGRREIIYRWGQALELIERIERGEQNEEPEVDRPRVCEQCGKEHPHLQIRALKLWCPDCIAVMEAEARQQFEARSAAYATSWQTWLTTAPLDLLRLLVQEGATADRRLVGARWDEWLDHPEIEQRVQAMDRAALGKAITAYAAWAPKRWPTWAAAPIEQPVPLPPRPRKPHSDDVSVKLAYYRELEKWADAVERMATQRQPAPAASSAWGADLIELAVAGLRRQGHKVKPHDGDRWLVQLGTGGPQIRTDIQVLALASEDDPVLATQIAAQLAVQPTSPASHNGTTGELRQAMMAFEDAVAQHDSAAAVSAALQLAHLLAGSERAEVAGLLSALARLMPKLTTEGFEDLSKAICDLNECQEGSEAAHWLAVGWALLDLEPAESEAVP